MVDENEDMGASVLPERPDAALVEILGRPCHMCINIANVLRLGGWAIKSRAEDEQAAVLLFTWKHWFADKVNWRENADRELQAMADAYRQALPKDSQDTSHE
jgi:hypothetical protein